MANNNHFNLTLDTLFPTGSITRPATYINANANLTITYDADAAFMKVWFDTYADGYAEANPQPTAATFDQGEYYTRTGSAGSYTYTRATTFDSSATYYSRSANYDNASWIAVSGTKLTEFVANGSFFYHLVLMDDVGNESPVYNTGAIVFDTVRPVAENAYMEDPDSGSRLITNNTTGIVFGFDYSDIGGSGVNSATISGADINTITLTLFPSSSSYTGTLDFVSGVQDGTKTISIVVTDQAGNQSLATTASIVLDTVLDTPVIVLQDDEGNVLPTPPQGINFDTIYVNVSSADTGVVGYKIWEGTDADEPADYTPYSGQTFDVTEELELSTGDGTKVIHAKIIDGAGTESSADPQSVLMDLTNPTNVTLTTDRNIISNVSGYTTAVLTLTGQDATSGIDNWTLSCGNTQIGTGTTLPTIFNLTSANSMAEGANIITLTVTDKAGNSVTQTVTITLDTTAPTVSIGNLDTWYNDYFDISVTYANDVAAIYAWANTTSEDTDASVTSVVTPTGSPQSIATTSIYWRTAQADNNYMHVKVVDAVGNVAYAHAQFGFDNVVPTKPTIAFSSTTYTSQSAAVSIQCYDATSGVVSMRVTGDITNPTPNDQWETVLSSRNVTLTSGDGYKNVYVQVKDAAGNVSVLSDPSQAELDTTTPAATLELYEANGTTSKPAVSPLETLSVRIYITNDDPIGGCKYLLYGDFTYDSQQSQGISEGSAVWTDFEPDSGQVYMTIYDMYCTSGDGTKGINIKVKDNAGNVSQAVTQSFIYDTSAPSVEVSNIDFNRLSKVHTLRRNNSGTIEGKYADQTCFTFTPSENIQHWKVCAYEDQAAAEAGDHNDPAIPNTAGSVNMTDLGETNRIDPVNCTIKGADYEAALGPIVDPGDNDGVHIVVVYVQDLAGTWSAAASFEVTE